GAEQRLDEHCDADRVERRGREVCERGDVGEYARSQSQRPDDEKGCGGGDRRAEECAVESFAIGQGRAKRDRRGQKHRGLAVEEKHREEGEAFGEGEVPAVACGGRRVEARRDADGEQGEQEQWEAEL